METKISFCLEGKTAVVTGGSQGIGKIVAGYLAHQGADIVIVDIQDAIQVARKIASEYPVKAIALKCDVSDSKQVKEVMNEAAKEMGSLDILFNNAGICLHKSALEVTPAEWEKVINVNLNGIFYMAREFAKQLILKGKKGSIINTASMSGVIVNVPQLQSSYNASKAAVMHLTKSLAVEWADKGIRVNAISPGYIRTEMTESVREDWKKLWEGMIPFGRMGTPEELAGAVIYLASDMSSYTSGLNMVIDGAFTCI